MTMNASTPPVLPLPVLLPALRPRAPDDPGDEDRGEG